MTKLMHKLMQRVKSATWKFSACMSILRRTCHIFCFNVKSWRCLGYIGNTTTGK